MNSAWRAISKAAPLHDISHSFSAIECPWLYVTCLGTPEKNVDYVFAVRSVFLSLSPSTSAHCTHYYGCDILTPPFTSLIMVSHNASSPAPGDQGRRRTVFRVEMIPFHWTKDTLTTHFDGKYQDHKIQIDSFCRHHTEPFHSALATFELSLPDDLRELAKSRHGN
jgi:hypothetical protein